jgi:shikimate dehydrogenase
MMNAAFSYLGIDETYFAVSLKFEELPEAFGRLKNAGTKGLNVTIPFKSSIIPLLDRLDQTSTRVGAVNVIELLDGKYLGHNSDVDGIVRPLRRRFPDFRPSAVVVIGAGGAARAFVEAMSQIGCLTVTIVVRDTSRASKFFADLTRTYAGMKFGLYSIDQWSMVKGPVDLLFNATPVGTPGRPLPAQLLHLIDPKTIVFDAVYRPVDTELILRAKERGASVVYGLEMLLDQGAVAFELWTGIKAPMEVMEKAIRTNLAGVGS